LPICRYSENENGDVDVRYTTCLQVPHKPLEICGRLLYGEPDAISNAIWYGKFFSRSHDAVVRIYDQAGKVIETHEHADDFREW
jgi:hypothetical protein